MLLTIDLNQLPEFQGMQRQLQEMQAQLIELRHALPEWVCQVEAERLTGHSRTTLFRLRNAPKSLIVWKEDRGVHYLRTSLLAHNNSRIVKRSLP